MAQTPRRVIGTGDSRAQPVAVPEHLSYIVIEGVLGVGKSALARLLAQRFNAQLVLEDIDENPFLGKFYKDRQRWAFQTQVAFLASRYRQQRTMLMRDLFHDLLIADYAFDKDRIFAHLNLSGDEVQLYETLYTLMEPNTRRPDLVIYLQSSVEYSMKAIPHRGRSYETDMSSDYLAALHEAYTYYFFRYSKSPLLIINTEMISFYIIPKYLDELVRQIVTGKHHGTTYFRRNHRQSNPDVA